MCGRTAVYTCGEGEKLYFCADHMAELQVVFDRQGARLAIRDYIGKQKCNTPKGEEET